MGGLQTSLTSQSSLHVRLSYSQIKMPNINLWLLHGCVDALPKQSKACKRNPGASFSAWMAAARRQVNPKMLGRAGCSLATPCAWEPFSRMLSVGTSASSYAPGIGLGTLKEGSPFKLLPVTYHLWDQLELMGQDPPEGVALARQ